MPKAAGFSLLLLASLRSIIYVFTENKTNSFDMQVLIESWRPRDEGEAHADRHIAGIEFPRAGVLHQTIEKRSAAGVSQPAVAAGIRNECRNDVKKPVPGPAKCAWKRCYLRFWHAEAVVSALQ